MVREGVASWGGGTPQGLAEARQDPGAIDLRDHARGSALTLYLDASAIFKLYVDERGSALMREAVVPGVRLATSLISYVEATAAFARRKRAGDLTAADHRRVLEDFSADGQRFVRLGVTERSWFARRALKRHTAWARTMRCS